MEDCAKLSFYHITPNAVVKMCFWPEWRPLLRASCKGDLQGTHKVFSSSKTAKHLDKNSFLIKPSAN